MLVFKTESFIIQVMAYNWHVFLNENDIFIYKCWMLIFITHKRHGGGSLMNQFAIFHHHSSYQINCTLCKFTSILKILSGRNSLWHKPSSVLQLVFSTQVAFTVQPSPVRHTVMDWSKWTTWSFRFSGPVVTAWRQLYSHEPPDVQWLFLVIMLAAVFQATQMGQGASSWIWND